MRACGGGEHGQDREGARAGGAYLRLIGGLHLFEVDDARVDWTASELKRLRLAHLVGAHCTGIEALMRLRPPLRRPEDVHFARLGRRREQGHSPEDGRASYVWSLVASIGTLLLGAVVGVWQGVHELAEPDSGSDYFVGYVVIAVSFVLEGVSFVQTIHQLRKGADELGRDLFEHALSTSNSTLRAVFTEDFTALIALVVAALGMALHQLTGVATYDGVGSILIGLLMVVAATMLISRNAGLLAGKPLDPNQRARLMVALRNEPEIERVPFVYAEVIGPERLLIIASVGIAGDRTQAEPATILREIERRLMKHKYVGLAVLTLATSVDVGIVA